MPHCIARFISCRPCTLLLRTVTRKCTVLLAVVCFPIILAMTSTMCRLVVFPLMVYSALVAAEMQRRREFYTAHPEAGWYTVLQYTHYIHVSTHSAGSAPPTCERLPPSWVKSRAEWFRCPNHFSEQTARTEIQKCTS
jgi:hypothetical protein